MPVRPQKASPGTRLIRRRGAVVRAVRRCRLRVISGPDRGRDVNLSKRFLSVGTHAECDLVLTDSSVSRRHLEIEMREDGLLLRDLGSTNGTFLGSLRLGEVIVPGKTRVALGESVVEILPLPEEEQTHFEMRDHLGELVGTSAVMQEVYALIEKVAPTDATVLVTGETGTGKELVAETIHQLSPRSGGPFVVVDCTALPPTLFESELFGYERGAFTGAVGSYRGAFERADGGTLFLDEVSELDLAAQPKLLRAIERRTIQRLGSEQARRLDFRLVAASRRDLGQEVRRGAFRDDLYFRLAVVRIPLPALRERREDIPLLAANFLQRRGGTAPPDESSSLLSPATLDQLMAHDWPGNVRELRNAVERALVLQENSLLQSSAEAGTTPPAGLARLPFALAKKKALDDFEREYLRTLLAGCDDNVSAAARAAGLDRRNLQRLLKRHRLRP